MVPNLRDGVTLAGSRLVCPRSERRFSVTIWVRCNGQFPGWASNLCLRLLCWVCFQVVPTVDVSFGCTCLSPVFFPVPCYGYMFASTTLAPGLGLSLAPSLDPAGWGWSLYRRLLFAPCSRWRLLSWWSSLRLRVFGGYWFSPLCFHGRRLDTRATCSALPLVSRLSFVLGEFSWLCFGLCLTILLASWGCRRAYCGPHCGSVSARVLASLLGPSPSEVRHLFRVCSSVGGPVGVAHSFHPSLLLGGVLVRLCGGLC